MGPEDALDLLGRAAAAIADAPDLAVAGRALVDLALATHGARAAFIARAEGGGELALRWVAGADREGQALDAPQHAKGLARVEAALRESLAGVREVPPPEMTGGPAPAGAVPVKTEAGQPPLHAVPIVEDAGRAETGLLAVLALYPDPRAPFSVPTAAATRAFAVARDVFRTRVRGELDRERGAALLEAAVGRPSSIAGDGSGDLEEEPGGDTRGFRFRYDKIVSRSPKMFEVFRMLDRVIPIDDVSVLIYGETGTGKELVARAIHENGPRRRRRLYTQNAGALAASLLESELFGHEKGAFTGADRYKKGLFEIASGSTLLLDEIGEMDFDMQAKLLRVLQEKKVTPLGGHEPVSIDVRVLSATHRDLREEIAQGRFREDLFHRLATITIHLPPLRERTEDIPLLVDSILRKIAKARNEKPKVLDRRDPRIVKCLVDYPWPGNVRELENVVTRLATHAGDVIGWEHVAEIPELGANRSSSKDEPERPVRPLEELVAEAEKLEIEYAIRVAKGNRTRAASLLGINRRSLLRRLGKYGMATEEDEADLARDGQA